MSDGVEAAKILGLREVPTVRLSNLSPADRRAYVITDNRLAELAGWDRELLASELQGLLELEFDDIELTGFSLGEIDHVLDEAAEKEAEEPGPGDELPANSLQDPAVSRAGDQWVLGPHRLRCGELDPLSCDVVVRRWQQYTGKAARLEGSTWADLVLCGRAALRSVGLRFRAARCAWDWIFQTCHSLPRLWTVDALCPTRGSDLRGSESHPCSSR